MKRLCLGLICILALGLLCSFAGSGDFSNRFSHTLLSGLHVVAPPDEHAKSSEFCILDPVAYAKEAADPVTETDKPPIAELSETTYDFGELSVEKDFVHSFSVRNTGKSDLNIKKVVPG
jgi:hypothetical protein